MGGKYIDIRKQRDTQARYLRNQRLRAIKIMGGRCVGDGCTITDTRVLQFDHKVPVLRSTRGHDTANKSARAILFDGRKDDYQLLCANCHSIKTKQDLRDGRVGKAYQPMPRDTPTEAASAQLSLFCQ
jgi:5-methylcytosine-specific restriction endonuclease McrA